jgi:hypothetical protein
MYTPPKNSYAHKLLYIYLYYNKPVSINNFIYLNPDQYKNAKKFKTTSEKLTQHGYLKKTGEHHYQITHKGEQYCTKNAKIRTGQFKQKGI